MKQANCVSNGVKPVPGVSRKMQPGLPCVSNDEPSKRLNVPNPKRSVNNSVSNAGHETKLGNSYASNAKHNTSNAPKRMNSGVNTVRAYANGCPSCRS